MSSEQPNKSPDGLEPKKSNTVLIVIVVLVVLTIPALCLCGGGAIFFLDLRMEGGQDEPFIEYDSMDSMESVPAIEPVPPIAPVPPVQATPPIEPAPSDAARSGDDTTTK
jgi:hypothetical protein